MYGKQCSQIRVVFVFPVWRNGNFFLGEIRASNLLPFLAGEEKVLLIRAGENTLRFIPPLIVDTAEIDEAVETLARIMNEG